MPDDSMDENGAFGKSFVCEGELGYLNDSCQRHGEYNDMTIAAFFKVMVDQHNREIANDPINKRFEVGRVTVTNNTDNVYRYLNYDSTLDNIFDKLVDRLGGELKVRKENGIRYLDYLAVTEDRKSTEIKLAKNLQSIQRQVDPTEVITRLVPLGMRIESEDEEAIDASQARLTIAEVNNGVDYIEDEEAKRIFGIITRNNVWDDITLPPNLIRTGREYLRDNNRVRTKYVISAVDLALIGLDTDTFEVGYYYYVENAVMGIQEWLRVVGKTIDVVNPNVSSLEIGDQFKTASQFQSEQNRAQRNVVELETTVARQSQSIGVLRKELTGVNSAMETIELTLRESDLPALNTAVKQLEEALENLNEAIEDLPVYDVVTYDRNGLMISTDKAKLDTLQNYEPATETMDGLFPAPDKAKLDRITVTAPVNMDELLRRLEEVEGRLNG
ncbi:phage tail protein [Bacillus sp. JCM 19041]|uniref:phage tail spike protein n=1 Tax=Bacillus sp. JCM 19041 TaxID=1460637 RepID=UPI0012E20BAB